jgi:hypothetical protein
MIGIEDIIKWLVEEKQLKNLRDYIKVRQKDPDKIIV